MFRQSHSPAKAPRIDLDTVRETLAYMQADMRGAERLDKVREALGRVLEEIDALDERRDSLTARCRDKIVALKPNWPRFVPWSAE